MSLQMMSSVVSEVGVKVSASTASREAFFLDFAHAIRETFPELFLMVTGGFRSRLGLEHAVKSGACDLVGIGRPSVVEPRLPRIIIFNPDIRDEDARLPTKSFSQATLSRWLGIKGLGGGTETVRKFIQVAKDGGTNFFFPITAWIPWRNS
jgi:hypothetical protein